MAAKKNNQSEYARYTQSEPSLWDTSIMHENRSRVVALEGSLEFIKEGIQTMSKKIDRSFEAIEKLSMDTSQSLRIFRDEMHKLLDSKYVSKEYFDGKWEIMNSRLRNVEIKQSANSEDKAWIIRLVFKVVITVLLGYIIIEPKF